MIKSELDALKAMVSAQRNLVTRLATSTDAIVARLAAAVPTPEPAPAPVPSTVVWSDNFQTEPDYYKWSFFPVCQNSANSIPSGTLGSDAAGASLSRVRDPAGGTGWAIRHYLDSAAGGYRAQMSLASWTLAPFGTQLAKGEVWIEQEMYIPAPMPTAGDSDAWLSIQDFHSHGANGENWHHSHPALMLGSPVMGRQPGQLVARNFQNNIFSAPTVNTVPLNRWFRLQVHLPWRTTVVPVKYYIDGTQVVQINMVTKAIDHVQLEWMSKWYGAGVWSPRPLIRYTRNVRIGSGFLS